MPLKSRIIAVALTAALFVGCNQADSMGPARGEGKSAKLVIGVGVKDVGSLGKQGLAKSQAITLKKLIVTLSSSVTADTVIRDTILAGASGFDSASNASQQVFKTYSIKPLRDWVIEVKTLDRNDSVIHIASDTADDLEIGETRAIVLNLKSRFVVYAAKFILPETIGSQSSGTTQRLDVNRIVLVVNGDTVVDSISAAGTHFPKSPVQVLIDYNYVRVSADTSTRVELYVYSDSLGSWDKNLPIFGDTIVVTKLDSIYKPTLPWMGPGSAHDPSGVGGGSEADLKIVIGPVEVVVIESVLPEKPLARRRD